MDTTIFGIFNSATFFCFILNILIPVGLSVLFYFLQKKTRFGVLSFIKSQIIIGAAFGVVAIFATSNGVDIGSAVLNVRDAGPICAGLIFGWPAALISGTIGAVFRYFITVATGMYAYTQMACFLATLAAGILAAVVKKFILDNRRSPWYMGLIVALVIESMHMILVYVFHLDDIDQAASVVMIVAGPMIIGNAVAVAAATAIIQYVELHGNHNKRKLLAVTFQKWLLIVIVIAFSFSFVFLNITQTSMSENDTTNLLKTNISDVTQDVTSQADTTLLNSCRQVKMSIDERTLIDSELLQYLCEKHGVAEICVVDGNGFITASSNPSDVGYNMSSGRQSAEFMCLLEGEKQYVQSFQAKSNDPKEKRKYAGMPLAAGGFVQVAYNESQFIEEIQAHITSSVNYRTVGETGYLVVCNSEGRIISIPTFKGSRGNSVNYSGKNISEIGINYDFMMSQNTHKMFEIEAFSRNMGEAAVPDITDNYCMYEIAESYRIIGLIPVAEVMKGRDLFQYISAFLQIFIFGIVFIVVYLLINKNVVRDISKVNSKLKLITDGNLDTVVDVRSHDEFTSLSNGINHTVDRLKVFIDEANARIDKELEFAKDIQHSALPNVFPAYPSRDDFDVFATMDTAKEVGGDFYDFYLLDDYHLVILMADVSGKGIPAAMFMMTAKTLLKSIAETGKDINAVVTEANAELCSSNDKGLFITMWMGIADVRTGDITYVNAGHNPPVLIRADGSCEYLESKAGFVLAGLDGYKYKKQTMQLAEGDKLFLYTDGITEAMNDRQELYGEDRLLAVAKEFGSQDVTSFCSTVTEKVAEFVGDAPQADDMTMLCYEFKGEVETFNDSIELDATIPNVDTLTDFINDILDRNGCRPKVKVQIDVAIDELFSNIAYYAYPKETVGKALVSISISGDVASLTFMDNGKEFNPLKKRDPNVELSAEERKIGGLGIYMVKKSMDHMSYSYVKGYNILTITKKIK